MSWLHRHPTHLHLLDSEGDSVMHVAVRRGNIAIVRLLLSVGFDINCRSADDWTVLEEAHACAPPQVLKAVYEAVQVDECRRWHGRSRQVVQGLRRMADFVIDVHWRLGMRVLGIGVGALLRRFLPSDTCTIRKRGARLRADAGLVGVDTSALAWRRGEISLFLDLECPRPGEAAWSLPGAYTPCVDAAGEAAVEPPREIEIPREIVMADHQARTTPRPSTNPNSNPHPNPNHNPNPNPTRSRRAPRPSTCAPGHGSSQNGGSAGRRSTSFSPWGCSATRPRRRSRSRRRRGITSGASGLCSAATGRRHGTRRTTCAGSPRGGTAGARLSACTSARGQRSRGACRWSALTRATSRRSAVLRRPRPRPRTDPKAGARARESTGWVGSRGSAAGTAAAGRAAAGGAGWRA